MIFWKIWCLVVTSNSVKLKSISSWPKMRAKTTENHFRFHFHFKWFPALENRRERERERERREERVEIIQSRARRYRPPTSLAPRRSRLRKALITIAQSADRADRNCAKCSNLMIFFWVLFVFWGMNDIIYSFGNRENMRKCEQQVENVFSMVFSRTQPNIRKKFSKIFLKCNQTHENIFLSGK